MVNVLLPRPTAFECRSERDLKGLAPILPVMDKLMGPMMRTRIAAAAAALLMALAPPAGAATETTAAAGNGPTRTAPTFGRTLPPIGFVKFCGAARRPAPSGHRAPFDRISAPVNGNW